MRSETSVMFKALRLRLKVVVRTLSLAIGKKLKPMEKMKKETKDTDMLVGVSV